jgi:hypothetical protein
VCVGVSKLIGLVVQKDEQLSLRTEKAIAYKALVIADLAGLIIELSGEQEVAA